jgi:hypothetical protein
VFEKDNLKLIEGSPLYCNEQVEDEAVVIWGAKGSLDFPAQCPKGAR